MFPIEPISPKELDYYVGRPEVLIIDLRERTAFAQSHIRGAVNIPYQELGDHPKLPEDRILIFYCDRGGASTAAARKMAKLGYEARSVIGGIEAYRGRNLVILKKT